MEIIPVKKSRGEERVVGCVNTYVLSQSGKFRCEAVGQCEASRPWGLCGLGGRWELFSFQERSFKATQPLGQARFANPGLVSVTPETLNVICHNLKSVMRHSRMPKNTLNPKGKQSRLCPWVMLEVP